ncbi:hypothetical protein INT43_002907 [Umbelopsis isabellina]|uniref:Protein BZZ1 n=1 Tax=Mortierella isabellina TaxID=91625 RepID=A0A8H7PCF2_MORIS|nr:hypothetical protein INT43_002907 [Umbelopsis isabellina]
MTTFGTDLKDQVPVIADHVADGIAFLDEFRSFAKDRAQIEKEYSQKLESLCKKYNSKRQKLAAAKPSTTPSAKQEDEWDWADKSSSTSNAWTSLLQQTELVAKTRHQLAEDLTTGINDVLKSVASKKEEARKKHVNFYHKLRSDRDKAYSEKDKAKQAYDEACVEVENLRAKLERGTGDQEKYNKQIDQAIIDRNNAKNVYILAIGVANAEKNKYFDSDIPDLSNRLQGLNNSRIQAGQQLLTNYISLDTQALNASIDHLNTTLTTVGQIDAEIDSAVFVRKAIEKVQFDKESQADFSFMPWNGGGNPSVIIDRDENMSVDDAAVVFLNNNLIKNKRKLNEVNSELSKKAQEVSKLQEKLDGYSEGAKYGAYDELNELLAEAQRHVAVITTYKTKYETEIALITESIGDAGLQTTAHTFKPTSFTIPTTCNYCDTTVWGLSKQGMTCKACGYNCHAKCEMKVPPNCTRVRGKIDRQKSLSRVSSYRPVSARSDTSAQPDFTPSLAVSSNPASPNRAFALYDYDAANPDEISIREGDEVSVIEPDDGSGWIKIRSNSSQGLVPANYIDTSSPNEATNGAAEESYYSNDSPQVPEIEQPKQEPIEYVTALYDFEGQSGEELSMKEGDRIVLLNRDEGGWWHGNLNGQIGIFPSNYVQ